MEAYIRAKDPQEAKYFAHWPVSRVSARMRTLFAIFEA
jgi:hypothetical protein